MDEMKMYKLKFIENGNGNMLKLEVEMSVDDLSQLEEAIRTNVMIRLKAPNGRIIVLPHFFMHTRYLVIEPVL